MDFLFETAAAVVASKEIDCPDSQETPQILLCYTQAKAWSSVAAGPPPHGTGGHMQNDKILNTRTKLIWSPACEGCDLLILPKQL